MGWAELEIILKSWKYSHISENLTFRDLQSSHFSALTKFQDFSRILYKIPGIIFFFFNVASTYNWVSVYTLYITSTPFYLHYPKVCIPPLIATHNDLYHFETWVLIKKTEINDLMATK